MNQYFASLIVGPHGQCGPDGNASGADKAARPTASVGPALITPWRGGKDARQFTTTKRSDEQLDLTPIRFATGGH